MITTAFISILNFFLGTIVYVFPVGSGFPQIVHDSASLVGGYVGILDPIFPIDTLYQIILLLIGIEVAIFSFKTLKWLLSHIPFVGGRG